MKIDQPTPSIKSQIQSYYDVMLRPYVLHRRNQWLIASLLCSNIILGIAIVMLLPLKERIPYVVEVENLTGRISMTDHTLGKFVPSHTHISFFLRLWISRLMTIDQQSINEDIPLAFSWTRNRAVGEFKDYIENKSRSAEILVNQPGFSRTIEHKGIHWISSSKTILADLEVVDRHSGIEKSRERMTISIDFTLSPLNMIEDSYDNPLGLIIDHFSLSHLPSSSESHS